MCLCSTAVGPVQSGAVTEHPPVTAGQHGTAAALLGSSQALLHSGQAQLGTSSGVSASTAEHSGAAGRSFSTAQQHGISLPLGATSQWLGLAVVRSASDVSRCGPAAGFHVAAGYSTGKSS